MVLAGEGTLLIDSDCWRSAKKSINTKKIALLLGIDTLKYRVRL